MTYSTGRSELVVVANRLPVRRSGDETDGWQRSPGGLVAALAPALATNSTSWVGWLGDVGDAPPPFEHEAIALHPVPLTADDERDYYGGFSNSTLWPLFHDAIRVSVFDDQWWRAYHRVNRRFAAHAAAVAPHGAVVWVHDYHLLLVPRLLREMRPDLRIGFFLHIPFPAQELFLRLPWRAEIVDGLLGADVVGFQTLVGADNFRSIAARVLGAEVVGSGVAHQGRTVVVGTYPVGIDARGVRETAAEPATARRAATIRRNLGDPTTMLLGVDRLDYTKGIDVRLRAIDELLSEERVDAATTVFVQIAEPSRTDVPGYAEIQELVEQRCGSINGRFGHLGRQVVHYLNQGQERDELVALYRAADVMLVTPLRDGMNLVAKEYVASRMVDLEHGDPGVLVLSEFTGAAHQLSDAVLVNPFDVRGLKAAIVHAIESQRDERRCRMRALAHQVLRHDASAWVGSFLADLARA